jgi:redox-sensing transcriptional repressor
VTLKTDLQGIPEPTLRRLPVYHTYLKNLFEKKQENVSGTQMADELSLIPIQIRKDLAFTGIVGKPKIGFPVVELMRKIEDALGWHNTSDAVLAGAGNLGTALLGYPGFHDCGLNIVMAFDADPDKINTSVCGRKVLALERMTNLVRRLNIHIGILTVPESACQRVADMMVEAGIKAIWNFAPVKLNLPKHIIVQHENLAASLAVLSKQLRQVEVQALEPVK